MRLIFLLAVILGLYCVPLYAQRKEPVILIGVQRNVSSVTISCECPLSLYEAASGLKFQTVNAGSFIVKADARKLIVNGTTLPYPNVVFYSDNQFPIRVGKRIYRGTMEVRVSGTGAVNAINHVLLEQYLYGVLPMEISHQWNIESQKAQAVAARTYALVNLGKHGSAGYDLTDTAYDQVYGGFNAEKPLSNQAVDETRGQVLTYNGKLIYAYYHSESGGHTENVEDIWGGYLPYLRGVPSDLTALSPRAKWERIFKLQDVKKMLNEKGFPVGEIYSIIISQTTFTGRAKSVRIYHSRGRTDLPVNKFRKALGTHFLLSSFFTPKVFEEKAANVLIEKSKADSVHILGKEGLYKGDAENIFVTSPLLTTEGFLSLFILGRQTVPAALVIYGKGWGHGVGLSQWGAKELSEQGYTCEEILKHYYKGVSLEQWYS